MDEALITIRLKIDGKMKFIHFQTKNVKATIGN